jgi:hypothetical protein
MKATAPFLSLLAAAVLATGPANAANAPAAETFGKPLAGLATVPLAELLKNPDAHAGKTLRTEGSVAAICAKKGCWMTIGDGEKTVRVTFESYGFFVPKDAAGATATLEGVFNVETIPEATAKHYAAETPGGKPDSIHGDQKELSFVATGVQLVRQTRK